jgi:hypothetical protein
MVLIILAGGWMSCSLGAPRVIALAQRSVRSGSRAPSPSGQSQTLIRSLGNWAELRSVGNRRERKRCCSGVDLDFRVPGADDPNSNSAHVARDLNIPHGRSIIGAVEDHESVRVFECSTMFVLEPAASNQLPPPPPHREARTCPIGNIVCRGCDLSGKQVWGLGG